MWRTIIRNIPCKSRLKVMVHANITTASLKQDFEDLVKHFDAPVKDIHARKFCQNFGELDTSQKEEIISFIASQHNINFDDIKKNAAFFLNTSNDDKMLLAAERLKQSLNPAFRNVFNLIIRLDHGIKFLVDFRSTTRDFMRRLQSSDPLFLSLKTLNSELKHLLAFTFSVGFLSLQRITWDSSCHLLQKISTYEAVHPVQNWLDMKRRVGPYRRCYVLLHSSMPKEPIVVLHTALTEDISSSINSIVKQNNTNCETISSDEDENPHLINAAVFYSITSTQKGLHGIELGNKLIKMVAGEILKEFPHISKLSSLSPIPGFRDWLLFELLKTKEGHSVLPNLLSQTDIANISSTTDNSESLIPWDLLGQLISSDSWVKNQSLGKALKEPLLKLCAYYLYQEKHRSYALNKVAHFHLRNGAVLWRLNWAADLSPRGINNSCGIMVNYRYFMEETDVNSQRYVKDHIIKISQEVEQLLPHLQTKL